MPALLSHLASCTSTRRICRKSPPLQRQLIWMRFSATSGFDRWVQTARRRQAHPRHLALAGFYRHSPTAEMAAFLSELPMSYRYSTRGISRRPADSDQPAHRVSGAIGSRKRLRTSRRHQRTFSAQAHGAAFPEPACAQDGSRRRLIESPKQRAAPVGQILLRHAKGDHHRRPG